MEKVMKPKQHCHRFFYRPPLYRRLGFSSEREVYVSAVGLFVIVLLLIFLLAPTTESAPHPPDPCEANGITMASNPRWEGSDGWFVDASASVYACEDDWPVVDHGIACFFLQKKERYPSGKWGQWVCCYGSGVPLTRLGGQDEVHYFDSEYIEARYTAVRFRPAFVCAHFVHDKPSSACSEVYRYGPASNIVKRLPKVERDKLK
jgi:hypothetical protein